MSEVFDSFGTSNTTFLSTAVFLLGQVIPGLARLPTAKNELFNKLGATTSAIADQLLEETRKEKQGIVDKGKSEDKSIIGLLSMTLVPLDSAHVELIFENLTVKAESSATDLYMSQEEIIAQVLLDPLLTNRITNLITDQRPSTGWI